MEDLKLETLWGYKLKELVEGVFSPKYMYNSLPFVVYKDGEHQIRWFYYDLVNQDNKYYLYVRRIITLDNTGRCAITLNPLVAMEWNLQTTNEEFLDIDFYNKFVEYFKQGDYTKTIDLLVQFESSDAISLYDELSHRYL